MSLFCQSPFFEQVRAPFVGMSAYKQENCWFETAAAIPTTRFAAVQEMPEKYSDLAHGAAARHGEESNRCGSQNAARCRA
jgi:hypothetical protein